MQLFVGVDWAENHHDVCVIDVSGSVRAKGRVTNDLAGVAKLHDLVGRAVPADVDEDPEVVVGIETDRGLLVRALVAVGYRVLVVNPLGVDRYRDRVRVSGAKSDPGDARVLADMVRTDGHQHRSVAADSDLAEAIKLVARSHQSAIWSRRRLANQVRSALREFYLAALDAFDELTHPDAVSVLAIAPTPKLGKALSRSKIASALRRGGRQVNVDKRAAAIQAALRTEHLTQPALVADAYGNIVASLVKVIAAHNTQIAELEEVLEAHFGQHPDAEILRSQPGLGVVTGARALYDHRRAAGDTHSGALRVVANRLVAIAHGCLKTRTL